MKNFIKALKYLFGIYLTGIIIMTLFRLVFFCTVDHNVTIETGADVTVVGKGFLHGLWFDNAIACYITILPLIIAFVTTLFHKMGHRVIRFFGIWFGVLYCFVFMGEAANIPFFSYSGKPLNASIWNWAEYAGTTAGMLVGETSYYLYILYFLIATISFCLVLKYLGKRYRRTENDTASDTPNPMTPRERWQTTGIFVAVLLLCLTGMRGRVGKHPIKVSEAYYCDNPVLNNMGINPIFSFLSGSIDEWVSGGRLTLMDEKEAVCEVQKTLNRQGIPGISPIAREVQAEGLPQRHNVVLVIMESMSAKLMGSFGNMQGLTPCLDSLYRTSMSFSNFYSSGNHTHQGLYATLCSFPSVLRRNAMKAPNVPQYAGLATILRRNGYQTLFFIPHEASYDNMKTFFLRNGYNEIHSEENYPKDKVVNSFGVPDDYLFSYSLKVLRERATHDKPFFATLLTVSNHPPYCIPNDFHTKTDKPETQIVEYADRSIGDFIAAAEKEPWAKNTIFVFVGDHGKILGGSDCELPECLNHIPLIIRGAGVTPGIRKDFAGQVDIAPTILGMLGIPYIQNNFGIDLNREQRDAIYYSADKIIAARDNTGLYVYDSELQMEFCYDVSGKSPVLIASTPHHQRLKKYCFSMLQTAEYMTSRSMTSNRKSR